MSLNSPTAIFQQSKLDTAMDTFQSQQRQHLISTPKQHYLRKSVPAFPKTTTSHSSQSMTFKENELLANAADFQVKQSTFFSS